MPQLLYKPLCEHEGRAFLVGNARCRVCNRLHQVDGYYRTMYEAMGRYSRTYGVKPIGAHRKLADRLFWERRVRCEACQGRGLRDGRAYRQPEKCPACEGWGGRWECSKDEMLAIRQRVLDEFPDGGLPNWTPDRSGFWG